MPESSTAPPAPVPPAQQPAVDPPAAPLPALSRADAAAAAALDTAEGVVAAHPNVTHWWNHASFALPLLGGLVSAAFGLLAGSGEALGFGLFLLAMAVLMLPVVLLTWRASATAVVLTRERAVALHAGRELRAVRWEQLAAIERVDTLGNVRWRLRPHAAPGAAAQHLTVEGEIADVPGLLARARALAGLPPADEAVR